jgi:hypothetical protein
MMTPSDVTLRQHLSAITNPGRSRKTARRRRPIIEAMKRSTEVQASLRKSPRSPTMRSTGSRIVERVGGMLHRNWIIRDHVCPAIDFMLRRFRTFPIEATSRLDVPAQDWPHKRKIASGRVTRTFMALTTMTGEGFSDPESPFRTFPISRFGMGRAVRQDFGAWWKTLAQGSLPPTPKARTLARCGGL